MLAGAKAGPDVTTRVAQAVSAAANMSQQAAERATAMIVRLWRRTNPYDQASMDRFLQQSGRVIVATQNAVASTAAAAQLTQLKAVGIDTKVAVSIPDNVRGSAAHLGGDEPVVKAKPKVTVTYKPEPVKAPEPGKPEVPEPRPSRVKVTVRGEDAEPGKVFDRAANVYRFERSEGADHEKANAAAEERITSTVENNVALAKRLAEQQTLAKVHSIDKRVIGWRRVIHPELSKGGVCGLCVAASDRVYSVKELMPIHDRCKCTVSPVTKSNDPGLKLNSSDLDNLYTDAGEKVGQASTGRGDLKRTRYDVVHHAEKGPQLVRVEGEKVPYYSTDKPQMPDRERKPAAPKTRSSVSKDTPEEVAARLLPGMKASLESLRAKGLPEDSEPIQYHLRMIAKFEAALKKAA